jgi:hypothetical protein
MDRSFGLPGGTLRTGSVRTHLSRADRPLPESVYGLLSSLARGIAEIKGYRFGHPDCIEEGSGHLYYVPDDTLNVGEAAQLGINGPDDLFGGVVPFSCMKTKVIVHPITDSEAERPVGWPSHFVESIREVVLPGFSVFSSADARRAAGQLLTLGPVRIKIPSCGSGKGQVVIRTIDGLDSFLDRYAERDLRSSGLVLELNLLHIVTKNIGQVTIDNTTISYFGTQRMRRNNAGKIEYGGSDLTIFRGGWNAIHAIEGLSVDARASLNCAKLFDTAAAELIGLIASRRNYDVGIGVDAAGVKRIGVLESSWRPGAASTAEIAALAEFTRCPDLRIVHASTVKKFGSRVRIPPEAIVNYRGVDAENGPIAYYTTITSGHRTGQSSIAQA